MVFIPTGMKYTARVKGHVPKLVKCEGCGLEYVYFLKGQAEWTESSPLFLDNQGAQERAQERASASLHHQLEKGCAPVPCPQCGLVQQHMFEAARDELRPRMWLAGVGLLILAGVLAIPGLILGCIVMTGEGAAGAVGLWAAIFVMVICSVILLQVRKGRNNRFDPNSVPVEDRKQRGRHEAMTRAEFETALQTENPGAN